ncbi:hypothetical protein GmHk_20G056991 [Glycine max]|nr:hypothetical protein GmHk_20G056991 [Glycine max]
MWDTLQLTHEGTTDVKRSRVNTLTHEYELFRMNTNENIQSMQKRFTHIVNHLASLGKTFPNEDLINKVLRCLSTTDVKRSRVNTLTHEYELFRMNTNENIQSMQKRFTQIVNHLASLGKTFSNEDLINKVLRCLSMEWQPKVTAISESKDLSSMPLATLFGKL